MVSASQIGYGAIEVLYDWLHALELKLQAQSIRALAAVVRDSIGDFIVADLGFETVIFETNAKLVVDAIRSWDTDFTEFGSIIAKCRALLHHGNSYSVSYVRGQANEATHVLARESRFSTCLAIAFNMPNCLHYVMDNIWPVEAH
ncbi:hypothetical protein PTKIN_Ptkin13bG0259600 [Pterospermum kingtungense]